ncbi:hypothetical protein BDB01DRAFT_710461, partial [Pilobolus umbonatus]
YQLIHNRQHYNPFRTALHNKLYAVIPLVFPYLSYRDIYRCLVVNHNISNLCTDYLWEEPKFDQSSIHDTLYVFNKFIQSLPKKNKQNTVKRLRIVDIEEGLYERIEPNFFQWIVNYCPQLESLTINNIESFSMRSLRIQNIWYLQELTYLDLSGCVQVTDEVLIKIACGCHALIEIKLDRLPKHTGRGLAKFADTCDALKSISVQNNTSLSDEGIAAIAKFGKIKLRELDLTGCQKITKSGFESIAKWNVLLTRLSLS